MFQQDIFFFHIFPTKNSLILGDYQNFSWKNEIFDFFYSCFLQLKINEFLEVETSLDYNLQTHLENLGLIRNW